MGCVNHPYVTEGLAPCAACGALSCPDCLVLLQGRPLCAACKAATLRDVRAGTQGGSLPLADIGMRFFAQLVDSLVLAAVLVAVIAGLGLAAGWFHGGNVEEAITAGIASAYVAALFLSPVTSILYEALMIARWGQTLGKMAVGIRVVSADGGKVSRGQAWGRAGTRAGLGLLSCIGILVDYVPAFTTPDRTCTHDMAARTRVVDARAHAAMGRG
jgi:uncharacterized RDD family membrane protein YckC